MTVRSLVQILLIGLTIACGDRHTRRGNASECFERYGDLGEPLTCVAYTYPRVTPYIVAPGRIRLVFPFAVPGVPANLDGNVFVVDVTPKGTDFVAAGSCGGGMPAAAAPGPAGFEVVCQMDGALSRLVQQGDRLVSVGDDLRESEEGVASMLALATDPPIVFARVLQTEPYGARGVWARAWSPDHHPFAVGAMLPSGLRSAPFPTTAFVQDGRVIAILGEIHDGWGGDTPLDYFAIDVTPDGVSNLRPLEVDRDDASCLREPAWLADDKGNTRLLLPIVTDDDDVARGVARIERALPVDGPTALADPADLCRFADNTTLEGPDWRLSCGPDGCVAVTVDVRQWELHVHRMRR